MSFFDKLKKRLKKDDSEKTEPKWGLVDSLAKGKTITKEGEEEAKKKIKEGKNPGKGY